MVTVKDIFSYFEKIVPTSMKLGNDNPGFCWETEIIQ